MQAPDIPGNEPRRLSALRALDVLDTPPEERFERITRVASAAFGVTTALVSLVDEHRQWFKSHCGLDATETPREISFCGHTILDDKAFVVPDTHEDQRFFDNPLVTGEPYIRFYAGYPLVVDDGSRVGTLCLLDPEPRTLNEAEVSLLKDLAHIATHELLAMQLATMDDLTALPNRRGFKARAQHALSMCIRMGRPSALVFFDLDNFKLINDRYGHAEGDFALATFAKLMRSTFRDADVLGRLGGDEFGAFISADDRSGISAAMDRLRETLDQYNAQSTRGYQIEYSAGSVSIDGQRDGQISELIAEADNLMYQAKAAKRS